MRAVSVVVLEVSAQDGGEVTRADDQEMVEALPAHGAHPTLRMSVCVRRPHRCSDHFGADRTPEVVKGPNELGVAVADQVTDNPPGVLQSGRRGRGPAG